MYKLNLPCSRLKNEADFNFNYAKIILTLFFTFWMLSTTGCLFFSSTSELQKAEEFSRQKKYPEAIAAYREHMQKRLNVKDRPEWENPYFYLILVGDIELGIDKADDALKSYLEAEEKGVDTYLVSDRIRSIARWYDDKNELDKAIQVLLTHRSKDPLLFDTMLDRFNKKKTLLEDQKIKP